MKKNDSLLIGSSEFSPDIRYLTGLNIPDEFIVITSGSDIFAIVSDLEISRARAEAKPGVAVVPEREFGSSRVEVICNAAETYGIRTFSVPPEFPLGMAEKLRAAGLTLTVAEAPFLPQREFKSTAERDAVLQTQRAGEAGFDRAAEVLRESEIAPSGELIWQGKRLTSEILRAEIDCAILRMGALPTGTICASGRQSSQPHNCGSGQIYADTPIVMDIFPRSASTGYWGDLTRTVVKGKAPAIVRAAYDAVLEAREAAKAAISIDLPAAELDRIARDVLDKHRFFTGEQNGTPFGFFHSLGHGVGLEIHEAPRLSSRSRTILRGGEIFTIEPGVYYPEWGGIRLEDLIYLDPNRGPECLTAAPDFLEIG